MKKIMMVLTLCLISVVTFGQKWDYIKQVCTFTDTINITRMEYTIVGYGHPVTTPSHIETTIDLNRTYDEYVWNYNKLKNVQKKINMPTKSVLMNYQIGRNCFISGQVFISLGAVLSAAGGICYMTGYWEAGGVLCGVGGSFIGISIPLLCFGDHIKRECNMTISK